MKPYVAHDQAAYPLATLLLVARERPPVSRSRLIALARNVSDERALAHGIPDIGDE